MSKSRVMSKDESALFLLEMARMAAEVMGDIYHNVQSPTTDEVLTDDEIVVDVLNASFHALSVLGGLSREDLSRVAHMRIDLTPWNPLLGKGERYVVGNEPR